MKRIDVNTFFLNLVEHPDLLIPFIHGILNLNNILLLSYNSLTLLFLCADPRR